MKVLSPQIGMDASSRFGGAVYDYEVLKRLGARGVDVQIPHLLPTPLERQPGWRVIPIPIHRMYRLGALLSNAAFFAASERAIRSGRPDLLRIAYPWYSGPALQTLGRLHSLPTVAAFHHLETDEPPWVNRVQAWVAKGSDGLHVGSRFAAGQITQRFGIPLERIAVIPYGVSERFTPCEASRIATRRELGVEERVVILCVGALIERKNLSFLIEVFESVLRELIPAVLLLVGEGYPHDPYPETLRRRIEASPVREAIQLLGSVSEERKVDIYRAADVLVHPALMEGFGLSVAEAMACETAVLVSNRGSLPEIVHDGRSGLLADPTNVGEFALQLGKLARDGTLRARLASGGRRRVRTEFSWEKTADETLAYYRTLVRE